jgi:hypothetical protein
MNGCESLKLMNGCFRKLLLNFTLSKLQRITIKQGIIYAASIKIGLSEYNTNL